ncbi:hypothetical protein PUR34_17470 [Streptomyces sp. JV185]|uniref:hypothetical protein n=1 Tax=Streptomyces sp. JV185 TaxID=858638 RepID=UPI002E76766E|nr:hypothetical protein [Streptomyces sp. JV185]MEE1769890.1 hypothetical protein [Streptomyces sp. JV185]
MPWRHAREAAEHRGEGPCLVAVDGVGGTLKRDREHALRLPAEARAEVPAG